MMLSLGKYRWVLAGLTLTMAEVLTAQPCLVNFTFTAAPPPVGGVYQSGQAVTFCVTISNWNTTNANWLHGVVPQFGSGWDQSTMVTAPPPATQGGSGGTWGWFPIDNGTAGTAVGPVGPGWFFDLDNDGTPGNNFGDYVDGPCNFQFCWTISVAVGANCITGGDLSMTASIYGDSETGSWGAAGCNGDINPVAPATAECCDADAGQPAVIAVCEDEVPFDLFALLGGTPDLGGIWTDPSGAPCSALLDPATAVDGVYTYTVGDVAPCPDLQATVTVSISHVVDAGLDNALTLCIDAVPLDMLSALAGTPDPTGVWTSPSGAPCSGIFDASTDPQGVYTYFIDAQAPCADHSATLTMAVDPAPWAGTDGVLVRCANDGLVDLFPLLGGAPDNGGFWLDPSFAPHSGMLNPPTAMSGAHAYVVPGSGACTHLIDTSFVVVTINPLPRISFLAEPDSGCNPLPVTFINTTPVSDVGGLCEWHYSDGMADLGCDQVTHTFTDPGSYAVQLTVTSPEGCTDFLMRPAMVLVEPAPTASYFFSPDPGVEGNSTVFFTAEDPHAIKFEWTVDGTLFGQDRHAQQWFNDVVGADYEVCLSVLDRYSCADTLCRIVQVVIPAIFVPNAFTPDGDGINDKFYPDVLDVVREDHLLQVFDRWGELIFSSTDPGEGWDGRYKDGGDPLPQGVYVWRLTALPVATADKLEMIGSVTLLK
ncbi:MAG: gliding motility-associated C-terminal domain-containing protein [Flavobacteriales bacterium]